VFLLVTNNTVNNHLKNMQRAHAYTKHTHTHTHTHTHIYIYTCLYLMRKMRSSRWWVSRIWRRIFR